MDIGQYHRIHLNSESLKKAHPEIYQDFFSKNSLVISYPGILLWSPIYAAGRGGAVITSKLPARVYVGLKVAEPGQAPTATFQGFQAFYPEANEFKTVGEVLPYWNSRAGKIINHLLKKNNFKDKIEISILSEVPIARGWHTLQAISAAISFALEIWQDKISPAELSEIASAGTEKLAANRQYQRALTQAWKITSYSAGVLDDGYAVAAGIIDSPYPSIYFHEEDPVYWDQYQDSGFDDPNSYYNLVERIGHRLVRMEEIFNLPPYPQWSINYGIIHVGKECPLSQIYNAQYNRQNQLEKIVEFTDKHFSKTVPENFKKPPSFLEICRASEERSSWMELFKNYRLSSLSLSIEFLRSFYNVAKFGYQTEYIRELFRLTNLCQNMAGYISPPIHFMDEVCATINHRGQDLSEFGVGVKMISQGVQGDILLITPLSDFEKVFKNVLPDLQKITRGEICCEYIARCDGLEKKGMRLEQYLRKSVYSEFISPTSLILKTIDSESRTHSRTISREEFKKAIKDFDIVADSDEKKIYIRGKALTSKDIHSAKVTLEILKKFFEAERSELPASALPESSYSSDRNAMESKIVRPLAASFERYTGKKINFKVTGGLGSDFSLILKPTNFKIGIVLAK